MDRSGRIFVCVGIATGIVGVLASRNGWVWSRKRRGAQQVSVIGEIACNVIVNGVGEIPEWGETEVVAEPVAIVPGGPAVNMAVWLGSLTSDIIVTIPNVGGTDFCNVSQKMEQTRLVQPHSGTSCVGQTVILTNEEDGKAIVRFGPEGVHVDNYSLNALVPTGTRLVHIATSGVYVDFVHACRKKQNVGFISLAHVCNVEKSLAIIPLVDFFVCNQVEAISLFPESVDLIDAILRISALCRCVVVTLGADGALLMRKCVDLRPLRILCKDVLDCPLVDTVGVGDAFASGLVQQIVTRNLTPEAPGLVDAVRFACACGTAACTVLGGSTFPGLGKIRECMID